MAALRNSKPRRSAKEAALDCLSRRALTYYELETRLKNKGYNDGEINPVLEKLLEWGYLNDQELTLAYAKSRLKRFSRRRVQQDLLNRGLAPELIDQALKEVYSSADEYQQCLAFAEQWWLQEEKSWEHKNSSEKTRPKIPRELWIKQKIFRKLSQRGYSSEMVRSVLAEIHEDGDEDDGNLEDV
ncbi:RecX family transcriptional regulator [Desulfosporosinus orientis]|uniref:regulatory protein RecX n=1 Tax=Desulfosporosinus orientis TaxID=1563 RepID=UPI0005A82566